MPYIYPTEPGWIEDMLNDWRASDRPYFSFCFLRFTPHRLRALSPNGLFWMYLYYTRNKTDPNQYPNFGGTARWCVHVLRHAIPCPDDPQIYVYEFDSRNDKIWFICDILEEIDPINYHQFTHLDGRENLNGAIYNSIAPIRNVPTIPIHAYSKPA